MIDTKGKTRPETGESVGCPTDGKPREGKAKRSWLARFRALLRRRVRSKPKRGANIYPLY